MSKPIKYTTKIPVFLHIPKNAGTYVLGRTMTLFRYYGIARGWNDKERWNYNLRMIVLQHEGVQIATVCIYDPTGALNINTNFTKHEGDEYSNIVEVYPFFEELRNRELFIFSIIVEDYGVKFINTGLCEHLCSYNKKTPLYYTILRDPYDRAQSIYNYIKSSNSSHEPTHDLIKSNSLEEYFKSNQLEDSWLIRRLTGIRDEEEMNEKHFDKSCEILDKFKISDITKTDLLIDNVFTECFGINRDCGLSKYEAHNKNANLKDKMHFNELQEETKAIFLRRTTPDRKIYERYCRNN